MDDRIKPAPFEPNWAIHPGATLSEWIVWKWAEANGFDPEQIDDICGGRASIPDELAEKLGQMPHAMSEQFWKNLQHSYDTTVERLKSELKPGEELREDGPWVLAPEEE